jgi:hypothetical protein
MTTSIQAIGERAEILNDLDVLALIALLNQVGHEDREKFKSLQPFFDAWQENCVGYGPGTIDLDLQGISASENAKSELEHLLKIVENKLGEFSEMIPAKVLTVWCKAPGVKFSDYPKMKIKTTIKKIRALMN